MNHSHELISDAASRLQRRVPPATPLRPHPSVSFEFFPPATAAGLTSLGQSANVLASFNPLFASVTYGAGGGDQDKTFAAIDAVRASNDLDVAGHLTCVAASKGRVHGVIDAYADAGVRRIVALRGDAPEGYIESSDGAHPNGYRTAADLVEGIRQRPDGDSFDISVGAYPEVHPKAASATADIESLKRKLDAGADRAITQFFFEAETFLRFYEQARAAGITAPIVPGIMPITNFAGMCRFAKRCNTDVPKWMHELFEGLDESPEITGIIAANLAAELCKQLIEHGVSELHFYTMNKPNLTAATCRILGLTPKHTTSSKTATATAPAAAVS